MVKDEELPKEIQTLKRHCIFCHKSTAMFCGGWTARTGGCCVGAEFKGIRYLVGLSAHIPCIIKHKGKIKTWFTEKRLQQFIEECKGR